VQGPQSETEEENQSADWLCSFRIFQKTPAYRQRVSRNRSRAQRRQVFRSGYRQRGLHRSARVQGDSFCARGKRNCGRQSQALEFQGWFRHTHQMQGCHGVISFRPGRTRIVQDRTRAISIACGTELGSGAHTQTHRRYEPSAHRGRSARCRPGHAPKLSSGWPRGSRASNAYCTAANRRSKNHSLA
jgi:hypothetical protein